MLPFAALSCFPALIVTTSRRQKQAKFKILIKKKLMTKQDTMNID